MDWEWLPTSAAGSTVLWWESSVVNTGGGWIGLLFIFS